MTARLYDRGRFRLSGDRAVLVEYGEGVDPAVNAKVRRMADLIRRCALRGVEAVVPSYRILAVIYDPLRVSLPELEEKLRGLEREAAVADFAAPRVVEIPVCYGGPFGPDIDFVAAHNGLTVDEVVQIHTATIYHIYAIGFAPGFCYLGGLDPRLHTPRLETPRTKVVAGSVGIAGAQTGVYPRDSPGGWRLIGRTPLKLFAPERPNPFLYEAGDKIKFKAVAEDEIGWMERRDGF